MKTKIKSFFCCLFAIILARITIGQKTFHVSINFPSYIETKKVLISYDNGKEIIEVTNSFRNNKISISGKFYSKYATIMFNYPRTLWSLYYNEFFVQTQPAYIIFLGNKKDSLNNPLGESKLNNAVEIKNITEAKKFQNYTLQELNDYQDFSDKFENEINSNDSMLKLVNKKRKLLDEKKLEYIKENGIDYFSFWIFRTHLLNGLIDSNPSELLETFNTVFPNKYKKSIEGKEIQKLLKGFLFTKKNYTAPNFKTKDITGKIISLKNYRGRYVLLNFWASWCGPCLEEVSLINKIRKTYSKDQLEIIGVSRDSDSSEFSKAIKKYQMNWVHIFRDKNFSKSYGDKPIPSLYLIDKKGEIIYSSWEDNNDELISLLNNLLGRKL